MSLVVISFLFLGELLSILLNLSFGIQIAVYPNVTNSTLPPVLLIVNGFIITWLGETRYRQAPILHIDDEG